MTAIYSDSEMTKEAWLEKSGDKLKQKVMSKQKQYGADGAQLILKMPRQELFYQKIREPQPEPNPGEIVGQGTAKAQLTLISDP